MAEPSGQRALGIHGDEAANAPADAFGEAPTLKGLQRLVDLRPRHAGRGRGFGSGRAVGPEERLIYARLVYGEPQFGEEPSRLSAIGLTAWHPGSYRIPRPPLMSSAAPVM